MLGVFSRYLMTAARRAAVEEMIEDPVELMQWSWDHMTGDDVHQLHILV